MIRGDISCNQSNRYKLYYLHNDHLGSTTLVTKVDGTLHTNQGYRAYGRNRINGSLPTDHKFTGQKLDSTGLYYYGSRYYDPELGQFISPDTIVPDPSNLLDYNRYMYTRGNPYEHELGVVRSGAVTKRPQVMYNLTVADAHTFFVGDLLSVSKGITTILRVVMISSFLVSTIAANTAPLLSMIGNDRCCKNYRDKSRRDLKRFCCFPSSFYFFYFGNWAT